MLLGHGKEDDGCSRTGHGGQVPHSGDMPEAGVGHMLAEHARLVTSDQPQSALQTDMWQA